VSVLEQKVFRYSYAAANCMLRQSKVKGSRAPETGKEAIPILYTYSLVLTNQETYTYPRQLVDLRNIMRIIEEIEYWNQH
jgi:hypothetical protein